MFHSRPGFKPVVTADAPTTGAPPARMNADMIPALNRRAAQASAPSSTLKFNPMSEAPPAAAVPPEVLKVAPEIIANPTPSPEPQLTSPHEE